MKTFIRYCHCSFILVVMMLLASCSKSDDNSGEAASLQSAPEQQTVVSEGAQPEPRPNILLIVVDDVAFNDLGIFGGEINTPNIDTLAKEGVVLTGFHASPNCSPTRAMLLSGTDNHVAGLGNMNEEMADNQRGNPGYEGYLNFSVAALPEILQEAGYHTYMTGKWHLGLTQETSPASRGFDKSFVLLQGGAGAFSNMLQIYGPNKAMYREDHKLLDALPEDFYSTRFYTEKMIEYIDSNQGDDQPFFAYLAFTAPHWPLQAPEESIAKYKGKYDAGYDVLLEQRLKALKARGLVAEDVEAFPRLAGEPRWEELNEEQQRYEAKKMEIYAAMVDDIDVYIGKLMDHLKTIGEYDNTFIFFMSDNGPEAHDLDHGWDGLAKFVESCCDNSYENIGKANSYIWYGPNWGQAGNTPLRMFKGFPSQGGVRVPAFAHYPKTVKQGVRYDKILTVMDVMPTILEVADIQHPGQHFRGREVVSMQGASMLAMLTGDAEATHADNYVVGWELFSKRALRQGDWKIIYAPYQEVFEPRVGGIKTDVWQLYNLASDPNEMHDLADKHPDKLQEMIGLWDVYVKTNGVILPDKISGY